MPEHRAFQEVGLQFGVEVRQGRIKHHEVVQSAAGEVILINVAEEI
jgi:hypothetical protein